MRLLLTSFGHEHIGTFLQGTVAYISDATRTFAASPEAAPFINMEREMLRSHGLQLRELPIATTPLAEIEKILGEVDGVYVAGGETFDLMWVLRSTGAAELLAAKVRAGLPYIGTSAGAVIAGPNIGPVSLLDSPDLAPELTDLSGLGLCEHVIIPHTAGTIPQFPIEVFAETVRLYGQEFPLLLLRDGQALLVDDAGTHLI
ncbi:Type 1 glutamine amidotransferase-like domain-containing protein [Corynebacterium callunae]|uniref:Type 1 glutamine amidotransferase-like domain-containing protein n=1 Tax=Corynebacterium callunae TaxID=1721 RepID=UPI003981B917